MTRRRGEQGKRLRSPRRSAFKDGAPHYMASPTRAGSGLRREALLRCRQRGDFRYKSTGCRLPRTIRHLSLDLSGSGAERCDRHEDVVTPVEERTTCREQTGYGLFFANGKIHFNMVSMGLGRASRRDWKDSCRSSMASRRWLVFDGLQTNRSNVCIFTSIGEAEAEDQSVEPLSVPGASRGRAANRWRRRCRVALQRGARRSRVYKRFPDEDEIACSLAPIRSKDRCIPAAQRTRGQA